MTDTENASAVESVEDRLVDEGVERLMDRADASGAALLGEGGLLTEVTRAVLERAVDAEMKEEGVGLAIANRLRHAAGSRPTAEPAPDAVR
ncbi:hypothetical protein STSP_31790 [Streptomyces jeddahensis]|uniref:Transposase n=1 Tax=Streptomyces jeddahensis TaxID=1716141 RepID=A0A177HR67_9ACTN|nr:hypothetical protein [Streptomyces jeddahensis]OAH13501.1 hypothetical protein STSP_31790 [Streptomyces jeddahensis]